MVKGVLKREREKRVETDCFLLVSCLIYVIERKMMMVVVVLVVMIVLVVLTMVVVDEMVKEAMKEVHPLIIPTIPPVISIETVVVLTSSFSWMGIHLPMLDVTELILPIVVDIVVLFVAVGKFVLVDVVVVVVAVVVVAVVVVVGIVGIVVVAIVIVLQQ